MAREMKTGTDTAVHDEIQLAIFKVGGEEYAIDIMRIMEIIRQQKVTRIPNAPKIVEGVINLRGKVVPILDLRKRFGSDPQAGDPKKVRAIILRMSGRMVGVLVDEVAEVVYMRASQIETTPEAVRGVDTEYLKGVGKMGDRLVVVLDIDRLLTGDELKDVKKAAEMAES